MTDAEQIKQKLDIVDFLSEYIQLKKAGRNFKALCPFHSEKTPSFVVSPERQSWHCFGACGEGGDAISFLQKWEGIEFVEALKILAQRTGVKLSSYAPTETSRLKERLYEINHLSAEFFHYLLTGHKMGERAREYLKERGIKEAIVKTFLLGYAPNSWDSLLSYLLKKGYSKADIYTAGLTVHTDRGSEYDRFRGRLMFTLRDHRGNIVGFAGRKLPPQSEKEAKYVNTPETPVYIKGNILYGLDVNREAIKKEKSAVVVEGEFDLLSAFQSGVTNVVAIKGSALTDGQVLLLKRYAESVDLSLDSDIAGNEAARRGIEVAENAGLTVKIVRLPYGKDPAECIGKDPHLFAKAIKSSIPVYDFVIENAFDKYGSQGVVGKKKIAEEVIPFLSKIENAIVLSHYIKYLSEKLGVSQESVEIAIGQFERKKKTANILPEEQKTGTVRGVLLEEYLLSLVVQSHEVDKTLEKLLESLSFSDFDQPPVRKIIEEMKAFVSAHKKFDVRDFGSRLSAEISPTFDKVLMVDRENILKDEEKFGKELAMVVREVKKQSLRREVNNLSTKIRQLEESGESDKIKPLNEKLRELIKGLNQSEAGRGL